MAVKGWKIVKTSLLFGLQMTNDPERGGAGATRSPSFFNLVTRKTKSMKGQQASDERLKLLYKLLRISFGIIYSWFGVLKFFPGLSPAESLAKQTIHTLTFGLIPDNVSIILLAIWEVFVGILFLSNKLQRVAITLALVHMACTFLPLLFFPDLSFTRAPYGFTIVGQYIVKNLVFILALLMMQLQLPQRAK